MNVSASRLIEAVAGIFVALGLPARSAHDVAGDLVAADLEGVPSHGVMLVPMYVERMMAGSVSLAMEGRVVSDRGAAVVLDAGHALGQLTARQAVAIAAARARELGLAMVTVRNAFHFGAAGRYARLLADAGCVGIVMSNTRPLMPAPGGAEAMVGNNPLAIALPTDGGAPVEVDMATSASAMGKIRLAAAEGRPIPADWALDARGAPTTDPAAAVQGMLSPAAGPKGFGLAFVIDLLCGGLSGGAIGGEVAALYGNPGHPYRCSHAFLAIDAAHFVNDLPQRVAAAASRVSGSRRAPGIDRVYAPGELAFATRAEARGICRLSPETVASLRQAARLAGADVDDLLTDEAA